MWFDLQAAYDEIMGNGENENKQDTPATVATPATQDVKKAGKGDCVAIVADVAAQEPDIQKSPPKMKTGAEIVLAAIHRGNAAGSKWQSRHGAVAAETGGAMNTTVTYQLIDRLIGQGRVTQAPDGVLSVTPRPSGGRGVENE